MKTTILVLLTSLLTTFSVAQLPLQVDTLKRDSLIKVDDIKQINAVIALLETDTATKSALKDITKDLPNAVETTTKVIEKIVKPKDKVISWWQWCSGIISGIITLLGVWAGIVKKISVLPFSMSPLHLIDRLLGDGATKAKGLKDSEGNIIADGTKAVINPVPLPDGYFIMYKKL